MRSLAFTRRCAWPAPSCHPVSRAQTRFKRVRCPPAFTSVTSRATMLAPLTRCNGSKRVWAYAGRTRARLGLTNEMTAWVLAAKPAASVVNPAVASDKE